MHSSNWHGTAETSQQASRRARPRPPKHPDLACYISKQKTPAQRRSTVRQDRSTTFDFLPTCRSQEKGPFHVLRGKGDLIPRGCYAHDARGIPRCSEDPSLVLVKIQARRGILGHGVWKPFCNWSPFMSARECSSPRTDPNPKPEALQPKTINPKPKTASPKHETLKTLKPKQQARG